jgi:ribosomal protein S18 acetylase RimI-like enzyme
MNLITIRPATLNDIDVLFRFEQNVISAERPFDPTLKRAGINYYDIKQLIIAPNVELVVAELGPQIIGCGYARIENSKTYLKHAKHAYLGFMYVEPAWRGKGVNQQIIETLKQWAIAQKVTELRLEVYHNNLPAIKAYEKAGFSKLMIEMRLEIT